MTTATTVTTRRRRVVSACLADDGGGRIHVGVVGGGVCGVKHANTHYDGKKNENETQRPCDIFTAAGTLKGAAILCTHTRAPGVYKYNAVGTIPFIIRARHTLYIFFPVPGRVKNEFSAKLFLFVFVIVSVVRTYIYIHTYAYILYPSFYFSFSGRSRLTVAFHLRRFENSETNERTFATHSRLPAGQYEKKRRPQRRRPVLGTDVIKRNTRLQTAESVPYLTNLVSRGWGRS